MEGRGMEGGKEREGGGGEEGERKASLYPPCLSAPALLVYDIVY